jgi:hypothetical protein
VPKTDIHEQSRYDFIDDAIANNVIEYADSRVGRAAIEITAEARDFIGEWSVENNAQ